MPRKPENTFILSVHKLLSPELHAEKMNNPYSSGTADCWYSGQQGDMWVEYKFIPKLPVRKDHILADCSPLQLKWLRERYAEGRKIFVVIGCPTGGVVLSDLEWERSILITDFKKRLITRLAIAEWIELLTRGITNERNRRTGDLRHSGKTVACDERADDLC